MSYLSGVPSFPVNFEKSARARARRAKYTGRIYGTSKSPDPFSSQHVRVLHAKAAGIVDQPIALGGIFSKVAKFIKKATPKEIRKAIPKELQPLYFERKILPKELSPTRMFESMRKKKSTPVAASPLVTTPVIEMPLVSQPFPAPSMFLQPTGSGSGGGGGTATEESVGAEADLFSTQNLLIAGALGVGAILLLRSGKGKRGRR